MNLAPVCDMTSDEYGFMYDRSFSSDVDMENRYVRTVVETSKSKKLGTVLKHFPGYGNNSDTHTGIAYDNRDYSNLKIQILNRFIRELSPVPTVFLFHTT